MQEGWEEELIGNQWTVDSGWTVGLAKNGEMIRSLPHTATKKKDSRWMEGGFFFPSRL